MFVVEMWGYFWGLCVCICIAFFLCFLFLLLFLLLSDPGEVPQGGFLHPSIEDKRLSKPHLESSEGSLWPGLAPSMAGLQQRNHRGIFCLGGKRIKLLWNRQHLQRGSEGRRWRALGVRWFYHKKTCTVYLVFKDCAGKGLISSNTVLIDWLQLQW